MFKAFQAVLEVVRPQEEGWVQGMRALLFGRIWRWPMTCRTSLLTYGLLLTNPKSSSEPERFVTSTSIILTAHFQTMGTHRMYNIKYKV